MSLILEKIDDEVIFDQEHIIMNYLKMYTNPECLKNTNIQLSQNVLSALENIKFNKNSQKFASDFFEKLNLSPLALDLYSPIISSFPNSNLGLFLAVMLNKNCLELAQNLNTSSELFQKYKNGIFEIHN